MQDFEPYFCTFEECNAPFDVPNSFDGLLEHLQSHLPMRHHVDKPGGEHKEFLETEFENHINSHGEVSDDVMAAMKDSSRRKGAFLFESCPFCGGYPDDLEKRFSNRDTLDAQRELRKHIKQHMQEIALFLPPYRSDIFDEDEGIKGSDVTHRQSISDEIPEDGLEAESLCDRIDCDCKQRPEELAIFEDHIYYVVEAIPGPAILQGWICCLCGNNYGESEKGICKYRSCDSHDRCGSCQSYTHDRSHIGDWPYLLDSSIYDHSNTTDDEKLSDNRLHAFILRYAFQVAPEMPNLALRPLRISRVRELIDSQNLGDNEPLPSATADGKIVIKHLLALNSEFAFQDPSGPQELLDAAQNGQLILVRRLLANGKVPKLMVQNAENPGMRDVHDDSIESVHTKDKDETSKMELNLNDLRPINTNFFPSDYEEGERVEAFYRDTPVWVEWIHSELSHWLPDSRIVSRVKDIVSMLEFLNKTDDPKVFPVPCCYGIVKDDEEGRIGIVYGNPRMVPPTMRPTSLRLCLSHDFAEIPKADIRVRLMQSLYKMVERFHSAGFLHRAIRSENILFFQPGEIHDFSLMEPYITGFSFSRPAQPDDLTERPRNNPPTDIYCHPEIQLLGNFDGPGDRSIFSKSHDLYSLGVVLLEIAHWKPIETIMAVDIDLARPKDTWSVQRRLLDNSQILENVRGTLGDTVEGVLRACISGAPSDWAEYDKPRDNSKRQSSHSGDSTTSQYFPLQLELATFFQDREPRKAYEESDIERIALLLRDCGERACTAPRTYIILRVISRLDIIDPLLDTGFGDYWFPADVRNLPDILDSRTKSAIIQYQEIILTKPLDLEIGIHCHFAINEILYSQFQITSSIGQGSYGEVHAAQSHLSNKRYALRRFRRARNFKESKIEITQFISEIQVMQKLDHRHVVQYVGSYTNMRYLGLLMSPLADCDLQEYMEQDSVDYALLSSFFGCLAVALSHLHAMGVRHDGLKPSAILVLGDQVLISGFGISKDLSHTGSSTTEEPGPYIPKYCAPEFAGSFLRDTSADIWSLGCIFLEMTTVLQKRSRDSLSQFFAQSGTGSPYYHANYEALSQVLRQLELSSNDNLQRPILCIKDMLYLERSLRPTASQVAKRITYDYFDPLRFCGACCVAEIEKERTSWETYASPLIDDEIATDSPSILLPIADPEAPLYRPRSDIDEHLVEIVSQRYLEKSANFATRDTDTSGSMSYNAENVSPNLSQGSGTLNTPSERIKSLMDGSESSDSDHEAVEREKERKAKAQPPDHAEAGPSETNTADADRASASSAKARPSVPRGILRRPTIKFPEDPEPIREGVAPLKGSVQGKDIPAGARWTKIDRVLVNPEALEEAHERFEERLDCVIVLRVLNREEIQRLADRTKEIRERRETLLEERRLDPSGDISRGTCSSAQVLKIKHTA